MLEVLFKQYPGFREVRMIEAKPGIAFVEFDDDVQSSVAMQALQGFKITPQNPMAITYAKKWAILIPGHSYGEKMQQLKIFRILVGLSEDVEGMYYTLERASFLNVEVLWVFSAH